jgi:hypothetical protein
MLPPSRRSPGFSITEHGLFAELYGLVLADPGELDRIHGGDARGRDLLELYSTTALGDTVSADGAAVAVMGLVAGYYSVSLRSETMPSTLSGPPLDCASGWVLHVVSDSIVVAGLGFLKHWNPEHPKIRRMAVPNGWYAATIAVGPINGPDDFGLELSLRECRDRPPFTADLQWAPNMSPMR